MIISMKIAERINEIFLRHRQRILGIERSGKGTCPGGIIGAGLKNLECMGYALDAETIGKLRRSGEKTVVRFFERTQRAVNALVLNDPGRDSRLKYQPMYPDFPKQVMEMNSVELYINALLHYLTDGKWLPGYEKAPCAANSGRAFVPVKLRVLGTATLAEFKAMFGNLMRANSSLSAADVEDLGFFFETFEDAVEYIPKEPVFKENNAVIASLCLEKGAVPAEEFTGRLGFFFETPTDVLRLAAALSKGDVSLARPCRFRGFSRRERKLLLELLDSRDCLLENMALRREVWLRLGERLHPGEYPGYGRIGKAFRQLREGVEAVSFAGKVERAFSGGRFDEVVALLSRRPGEFARALDRLLRNAPDPKPVLDAFEAVADRVNTRVLLEVRCHFLNRSHENFTPMVVVPDEPEDAPAETDADDVLDGDELSAAFLDLPGRMAENSFEARRKAAVDPFSLADRIFASTEGRTRKKRVLSAPAVRVFLPKGRLAQSHVIEDTLTGIPEETCRKAADICENALKKRYAERPSLGKVWVAEELKDCLVPFSQRSASKALRTIVRGSRLRFGDDARVIRGFLWWKNAFDGSERTDLDLSALLLDEKWRYVEHISYTNLRSPQINSCHSGDIVDAPKGAAEYVDIDIEAARKARVRYVVFSVHGYTRQNFCDLPECSFGWMERETVKPGEEIFDASALGTKVDLAMESRCGVPVFFDLKERCAVWMDMATSSPVSLSNCLENKLLDILLVCRGFASLHKPDLYDLAVLHGQARGEMAPSREEADTVFALDGGITPFDADVWMADYI